jgi:hypothetical protein
MTISTLATYGLTAYNLISYSYISYINLCTFWSAPILSSFAIAGLAACYLYENNTKDEPSLTLTAIGILTSISYVYSAIIPSFLNGLTNLVFACGVGTWLCNKSLDFSANHFKNIGQELFATTYGLYNMAQEAGWRPAI